MRANPTPEQVQAAMDQAVSAGACTPALAQAAVAAWTQWREAAAADLSMCLGGPRTDPPPSALYAACGDRARLAELAGVLRAGGIAPPWTCPDCATGVGQHHADGCDVGQCPACGRQALSCQAHLDAGTQVWAGRRPGAIEIENGWATDLNEWALGLHSGTLVWDRDRQLAVPR